MTISIWRYSHLALAVSSFLFLALASITGVILAIEPIVTKVKPYQVAGFDDITLAQTLPELRKVYPGITELSISPQGFVEIKGTDESGKEIYAYVDPGSGKILGIPQKQSEFFQWVTALHRSLFIHETGRFLIGLTSFLLLLITISGTFLVIQRQRGLKRFFSGIARDSFAQYYHVVLSRWSLIPIFIIALSGTYLSLVRFELINTKKTSVDVDFESIRTGPSVRETDFDIFRNTKLKEVETIEFPFSEDVEDYYTIKLKTGEIAVNQVTGDILGETRHPVSLFFTNLSLDLHTGRSSIIWAIIIGLASANILFFIYSGFAITIKRRSNRTGNKYKAEESRFIILVGSENGSTFGFARAIHLALLKSGEKSFITELNSYKVFPSAEHLIVVTATYGLGDPPTNAKKFSDLINKHPQKNKLRYSVLGFGSHNYPDFCQFAFEVNQLLSSQTWASAITDIHTVNDRSVEEFSLWAEAWSQQSGVELNISSDLSMLPSKALETFKITNSTAEGAMPGDAFSIGLLYGRRSRVKSGDLLAIYPASDNRERLYSIGVFSQEIRLSVKLYAEGLGSGYLHKLRPGEKIRARIIDNKHFHFPETASDVIMISNGTGIAPFLGMISENTSRKACYLYCGFRKKTSYNQYQDFLEESRELKKVISVSPAFSRDGEKQYVSDLIQRDAHLIAEVLIRKGVIMICGSLAMQKDVMELIDKICETKTGYRASHFQAQNQILTDCY